MRAALVSLLFLTLSTICSQIPSEPSFSRNGKWILETGFGSLGVAGNSTGVALLFPEGGGSLTLFSFEGGKFISENFALLGTLSHLDSGFGQTTLGLGGKYYAGGNIPIKFGAGAVISSGFGSSATSFLGNFSVGYAARLADNILLEPRGGVLFSDSAVFTLGASFALII